MSHDPAPKPAPCPIPPRAADEWLALTQALEEAGAVPCQAGNADAWWPDSKRKDAPPTRMAIEACRACPAAAPCLTYALAADERFGIWGGTTPEERRTMQLGGQLAPPAAS